MIVRAPSPALRPFISALWMSDGEVAYARFRRERVVPTGECHLVVPLPLASSRALSGPGRSSPESMNEAVLGGIRSTFYVRSIANPERSVGAMLRPGATEALFGVAASELAETHTALIDLWGSNLLDIRDRLMEMKDADSMLDLLEVSLARRLPVIRGLHPAVAHALRCFDGSLDVSKVVAGAGLSHRRFIANFRRAVGTTPKTYSRLARFQRVLKGPIADDVDWSDVAHAHGYSDQSHLLRDFREFAGLTPCQYRLMAVRPNHIPID